MLESGKLLGMNTLNLPTVVVERKGDDIHIKHIRTGMTTTVTVKQMDSWAVSQLRKELLPASKK